MKYREPDYDREYDEFCGPDQGQCSECGKSYHVEDLYCTDDPMENVCIDCAQPALTHALNDLRQDMSLSYDRLKRNYNSLHHQYKVLYDKLENVKDYALNLAEGEKV